MSEPFLSEIKIMSFNYPPKGWAFCNGQLLPINQNQALFSLLGTTYGGNGQTNFGLPDLRGRVPVHFGAGFSLGEVGGQVSHTVILSEYPQHIHTLNVSAATTGIVDQPTGNSPARASVNAYGPATNLGVMNPQSIGTNGGSQAHENRQPYLVLNYCIALQGIFPSQT